MTTHRRRTTSVLVSAVAIVALSLPGGAQTPIEPPSNSYTPAQDVQLGREAADEVRKQLPMLRDDAVVSFVDRVGDRLVAAIPPHLQQPAFQYTFEVVNLRDINAFALPGGPMFLHRGMIEAAATDGEVAGVMAHELSHVVLRHGTAQATKGQRFGLGALAGQVLGAIVGGRTGQVIAEGSQFTLGAYFLKYSREYERQADLLGAQIMARAGYDPRQMANMFRTIQKEGGSRGPEWLSSHPDPGNRYSAINQEAQRLTVAGSANTAGSFERAQSRLAQMPRAPTMAEVSRGQGGSGQRAGAAPVAAPSSRWQTHRPADFVRISVPDNWRQVGGRNAITYAPEGGYVTAGGRLTFTHGVQLGVADTDGVALQRATEQLIDDLRRANPQLRRQSGYSRTTIGGRRGLVTTLSNVSEVTGQRESVSLSTVPLRNGHMLFIVGVAPASEARAYSNTFARVRQSVQLAD